LDAGAAVRALYELASAPATAPNALALLHELQAHQVELDLQTEELHRMQAELEISLQRRAGRWQVCRVQMAWRRCARCVPTSSMGHRTNLPTGSCVQGATAEHARCAPRPVGIRPARDFCSN
jgi:hypothetical protein